MRWPGYWILYLNNPVLTLQVLADVIHPSPATEEANEVPEMSVSERRPIDSLASGVEMFVSPHIHPLVGRHPQVSDLVDLTGEQEEAPGQGEELGGGQQEEGGTAGGEGGEAGDGGVG